MSAREKEELVDFIAATGENYQRYLEWAEKKGVKPFTQGYLHTWVQRRRIKVQKSRELHIEHVRQLNSYTRKKRISEYEKDINRINALLDGDSHTCSHCSEIHYAISPETIIKLTEQKRRNLESIAKERNEWQRPDDNSQDNALSSKQRLDTAIAALLPQGEKAEVIDSTARVVE